MEAKQIRTMLDEEIEVSDRFTKDNFGLKVGDGFPELVREIAKSDKATTRLIVGLVLGALNSKELSESMGKIESVAGQKLDLSEVILKNFHAFEIPLALFYWGMQVGRKVERQEAEMLGAIEKDSK